MDMEVCAADTTGLDFNLENAESEELKRILNTNDKTYRISNAMKGFRKWLPTRTSFSRRVGTGILTIPNSSSLEYLNSKI